MITKTFFFVRHGQTGHNTNGIHQDPSVPLSEAGEAQAKQLAQRLGEVSVDRVISSTYTRARQTAEHLAARLEKPIQFSELLVECRRPSFMVGLPYEHESVLEARDLMEANLADEDWHYSDEENLYDWKQRADKVRKMLESADGETILVVSHGHFLRILCGHLLFDDLYSADLYLRTYYRMTMANTGISEFTFDTKSGWRLVTWNDRAHLA